MYSGNPVLQFDGSGFDATRVERPTVLKMENTYYMYYGGLPFSNNYQTGLATSSDGITWTKYSDSPVIGNNLQTWCAFRVMPVSVMYKNNLFKLWFHGDDVNLYAIGKAGYAYSSDGVNWTLSSSNPVISKQTSVLLTEVIEFGGKYYAYYINDNIMYYATSTDGIQFIEQGTIATDKKMQAAIRQIYQTTEFVFSIWSDTNGNFYYGISKDGVNFNISPSPITFSSGSNLITYDEGEMSLIVEDGLIKIWASVNAGNINWSYGNVEIWYGTAPELDWGSVLF